MTLPWDTPGLPTRLPEERCRWHDGHCAYRDDDPNRCTLCHASVASGKCTCEHGPLTLAATDTIREQFTDGGVTLRELARSNDITTTHLKRILKGVYNSVRDADRNPQDDPDQAFRDMVALTEELGLYDITTGVLL